ncbi:MAG TPA: LPS assembly lipoprotein LptE [Burkholderiales bacterium]|nr:LPS assembly lipoprotein LptE [Burkholderiales bacterium]
MKRLKTSSHGLRLWGLAVVLLLAATTLSACGFRLRGQAALPFESIYIETVGFSLLGAELRRAIRTGGKTRVADRPDDAEVVLRITGEQQEKHVLSLSTAGKVREFELRYRLAYRLLDRTSNDIVPPDEITLRRDLTYDDTQVLAKESEEALLYEDMKSDAVQQLLRRLSVVRLSS